MSKYPYIPKPYYAATMFACKMIREGTGFNVACHRAADYYNVDEAEVRKHCSARSAAGRKAKSESFRYKWFIVRRGVYSDARGMSYSYRVERGKSKETVERRHIEPDWRFDMRNDTGGSYSLARSHKVVAEFDSKSAAEEQLPSFESQEGW